jgi:hypothetical protein
LQSFGWFRNNIQASVWRAHDQRQATSSQVHRNRSHGSTPSVAEPRRQLLLAVRSFVRAARDCRGVLRIALVGSLTTTKAIPKDADVLVTIDSAMDLAELARAGRRLKASRKPSTSAPTSSSPTRVGATSVASVIIVSAIHAWHASLSIAAAASTSTTTFMSSRYRKSCLPRRQSTFGQTLSGAAWCRLMWRHSC